MLKALTITEYMARYRPETDMLVITMMPNDRFPAFSRSTALQLGDFVILTPRSLQPSTEE